jgi:hypothetical protein
MENVKYWIVWNEAYDTFNEYPPAEEGRYTRKEVADEYARLLNKGWGNRAYVEPVLAEPEVNDITLKEFKKEHAWMYEVYR